MFPIQFFQEDVDFKLADGVAVARWIAKIIDMEGFRLKELTFVFCSDEYLYELNSAYLDHDTYTDIITFDNSDVQEELEGDIFISIPRVTENAEHLKVPLEDELHRVIIHGVLHLMGYNDKTPREKNEMRNKEAACLSLRE